ncbi:MAG: protein-disulfide reductase DsbD family protein [Phycisphaerales bacterium]|nr:protein-disulfide reductase DsbD family protein [Phycisphaerales bacterium]
MKMLSIVITTMLTNVALPPPLFPPTNKEEGSSGHAAVVVSTDVGWIGPSQEFHVVVAITPDEGWHTYWKNPGDSGSATKIEIEAPEGYSVGKPIFPRPEIFNSETETTFGYGHQAAIFIPVKAPSSTLDGRVDFQITTSWLACKKRCVQGEDKKTLTVSVRAWEEGPLRRSKSLARWQELLPKPLEELENGNARLSGNMLRITGETTFRQVGFLGIELPGVRFFDADMAIFNGNTFSLSVPVILEPINATNEQFVLEGLLILGREISEPSFVVKIIVNNDTNPQIGRGKQ